jgi:hypothetical protein
MVKQKKLRKEWKSKTCERLGKDLRGGGEEFKQGRRIVRVAD